jgi:hypothetical protein
VYVSDSPCGARPPIAAARFHPRFIASVDINLDRSYGSTKSRAVTAEWGFFTAEIVRKGAAAPIQAGKRWKDAGTAVVVGHRRHHGRRAAH